MNVTWEYYDQTRLGLTYAPGGESVGELIEAHVVLGVNLPSSDWSSVEIQRRLQRRRRGDEGREKPIQL